jgi:hypothetical protein
MEAVQTISGSDGPFSALEKALKVITRRAGSDPSIRMKVWWLDTFFSRSWTRDVGTLD